MGTSMSLQHYDATPSFQILSEIISHKIIHATTDIAKTAQQIALEKELPVNITYKNS
jgi:hypothetical protein